MKKLELAMLIGIVLTVATAVTTDFTKFNKSYQDLQDNVLRLHILANSDSDEDQALKLTVRDELLKHSDELFRGCDIKDAQKIAAENTDKIEEIASDVIKENGYDYPVTCQVTQMHFDKRVYDDFTMPAGTYEAVRILIGKGEGHNWWCVMYPPLCLPACESECSANDSDGNETEDYFNGEELDMLENPDDYEIRFKCVEIFDEAKDFFKDLFD